MAESVASSSLIDVLLRVPRLTLPCLDQGFVRLVDVMPRLVPDDQTCDLAVVQAARVSYGCGAKSTSEDQALLRYLVRQRHTTPLEQVEFKFHMKLPIFCARQLIRHRTASVNEQSGRYSLFEEEFYFPELEEIRRQATANKQGGEETVATGIAEDFTAALKAGATAAFKAYCDFAALGVAREQTRMLLPVHLYTQWYWKIDLHNLLSFLALRLDSHAQGETRVFAAAVLELIRPLVPWTIAAWEEYHPLRQALLLTRTEVETLRQLLAGQTAAALSSDNRRERSEWQTKAQRLGLSVENA